MTPDDIINEPQITKYRADIEALSLNYETVVSEALDAANKTIPIPTYPEGKRANQVFAEPMDKSAIISFVVNFILGVLKENIKPKRKGWQIVWDAVFSIVPQFLKKKK